MRNRFVFLCWNSLWRLVSCGYRFIFISFFLFFSLLLCVESFSSFRSHVIVVAYRRKISMRQMTALCLSLFHRWWFAEHCICHFCRLHNLIPLSLSASHQWNSRQEKPNCGERKKCGIGKTMNHVRTRESEEQEMLIYLLFVYAID